MRLGFSFCKWADRTEAIADRKSASFDWLLIIEVSNDEQL